MKKQSRRSFLKNSTAVATGGILSSHLPLLSYAGNTSKESSVRTSIEMDEIPFKSGRSFTIALDPAYEVFEYKPEITDPKEEELSQDGSLVIPTASVSAIEIAIL